MKKYLFFDTTWNQILRVGNLVSREMKCVGDVQTYGLVYETSGKAVNTSGAETNFDDFIVTTNIYEVENYINKIKPDVVVFAQNTTPDLGAIYFAQKVGAKIAMMQHGVLYDGASLNNVRVGEIFAALRMAKKTLAYFNIMRVICKRDGKSFIKLLRNIVLEKDNVTTTVQNFFNPPLRGDVAFVIGEHWRDFYHENYGYDKNDIYIMGNHDVDDLEDKETEDAICYIPSVHVEDGHVSYSVFENFLVQLKNAIPEDKKFYIKLHPRSNREMYEKAFDGRNVKIVSGKELPYVNLYIGHNSSLLSKALQISGKLILWGFKEEKELFFKDFAYAVCHDGQTLKNAIAKALEGKGCERKKDVERFSYRNPVGAYKYCATKLFDLSKG